MLNTIPVYEYWNDVIDVNQMGEILMQTAIMNSGQSLK